MTVTVGQIRDLVRAGASVSDATLQRSLDSATELVGKYVGETEVPAAILDRAVLVVAVEQVQQDQAPNGIVNQAYDTGVGDFTSTPLRIGRDPMKPAYPILEQWVGGKFFCA